MFTSSVSFRGPTLSPLSPLGKFESHSNTNKNQSLGISAPVPVAADTESDGVIIAATEALLISIPAILAPQLFGVQSMIL